MDHSVLQRQDKMSQHPRGHVGRGYIPRPSLRARRRDVEIRRNLLSSLGGLTMCPGRVFGRLARRPVTPAYRPPFCNVSNCCSASSLLFPYLPRWPNTPRHSRA